MDKISNGVATLLVITLLIVGGLFTYVGFPQTIELKPDKCVAVPCEAVDCEPVTCTPTEVIKEVPAPSILDTAVATFMKAVEDEEDEAGNSVDALQGYDFDQIKVNKISRNWNAAYGRDTTTVNFEITLKYKDPADDNKAEKYTYDVAVTYETDEDTIVEAIEV